MFSSKQLLFYIVIFAFLLRVVGIGYGLPLWVIDDEPPFTLAALKMIQLKTLLPVFHLEDFRSVLYYPPYLSYLYIPFFSLILALKYLLFSGDVGQFTAYLASDLSHFFLIARFLNVLMGALSVYFIYGISKNLFNDERIALFSSFFLSTSIFHVMMSSNGRHWLPVSFFLILIMYFLSDLRINYQKRYLSALVTAGVGMGVSPIVGISMALIGLWYLFLEQRKVRDLFSEKYFYLGLGFFIFLAILPGILYPQSFGFRGDLTFGGAKSFFGLIRSPFDFLNPVTISEPILILFAFFGLIGAFFRNRNIFWTFFIFIYSYSAVFYILFRYEHRFTLALFPIITILAAYGFVMVNNFIGERFSKAVTVLALVVLAVLSLRLSYLLYHGDSRNQMIEWLEYSIPENSRILVYSRLTRISSSPEAINEQRGIDSDSLRKVDIAEEVIEKHPRFHALNLYTIQNEGFYSSLDDYVEKNDYQYLVMSLVDFERNPSHFDRLSGIAASGKILRSFGAINEGYSPYIGQLWGNPLELFKIGEFGPPVAIYKLD